MNRHVRGRAEVLALHIFQLLGECLLRSATSAGVPLDSPLIDHDRKGETRMLLGFRHHKLRALVDCIVWAIPVNNHSINSAADHVVNLTFDLRRVGGTVTDIHVVRLTEPEQQMSVDLCSGSRVKQRMNVNLAYVSRSTIPTGLVDEHVGRACVIRGLSSESRGWHYVGTGGAHDRCAD